MRRRISQWSISNIMAGTLFLSVLPFVAVEVIPALNFEFAPPSYLLFHNIAELFSVMVALSMFGMGWFTYDQSKNRQALFLSTAFLGIGLMDFMHTLANAAMPPFITPNSPNKSTQFWIAVRLFQAAAFLVSASIYSETPGRWMSKKLMMTVALSVPFLVFTGITFFPASMPATYVTGVGLTPFKKIAEYLIIGLLCAAVAAFWRRIAKTGDRLLVFYLAAFAICIFSELSFTVYTSVFDTFNVLGHIYKVAAFSLIYYGVYRASIKAPYLQLIELGDRLQGEITEKTQTEEALRQARHNLEIRVEERTAELTRSNMQLRKEIEDRRKAEENLEATLESIGDGFFCCDAEWRFVYVNTPAERILGLHREEMIGRNSWELFPQTRGTRLEDEYRRAAAGEIRNFENYYAPWGRWFHNRCFPREGGGMAVYFQEITERKQMEDELRRSRDELELQVKERTEELNERVAHLARLSSQLTLTEQRERRRLAVIIHDNLQQLLVGAKMRLEVLLTRLVTHDHRQRLMQVHDLLVESLTTSRSLHAQLAPQILHERGLAQGLEWLTKTFQDTYQIRMETDVDLNIQVEREDLKILLFESAREFLFNAVKHAGSPTVHIRMIRNEAGKLQITVSDQGIGFEPETLMKELGRDERFGLFSIRERLELLGGRLEIESSPGSGASFTMIIPMDKTTNQQDHLTTPDILPAETSEPQGKERISVLLVDDHTVMRHGLQFLLEMHADILVLGEAADGETAVQMARSLNPEVILMDISMPKMGGMEATRMIHAELPHIRIIGLSMYDDSKTEQGMLDAGATCFVCKSGHSTALLAAIRDRGSTRFSDYTNE